MRKRAWTDKKLKAGFDAFIAEHGRLPRSYEVDESPLLPTARAIQKRYGGLKALREHLGYTDTNFGAGTHRSKIAHTVWPRGRQVEADLKTMLIELFGSDAVHTEKIFHEKQRVDFYVSTPLGTLGVDIFFPASVRTMQNNINIKMKKYQYFSEPLYLVVANPDIRQRELNRYTNRRVEPFAVTTKLVSLYTFKKVLKSYQEPPG